MDVSLAAAYQRLLAELSQRLGAAYAELLLHVDSQEPAHLVALATRISQRSVLLPNIASSPRDENHQKERVKARLSAGRNYTMSQVA